MGNKEHARSDDFNKMLAEMRKDQSRRVNINPEKVVHRLLRNTSPSWRSLWHPPGYPKPSRHSYFSLSTKRSQRLSSSKRLPASMLWGTISFRLASHVKLVKCRLQRFRQGQTWVQVRPDQLWRQFHQKNTKQISATISRIDGIHRLI